MPSLVSPKILIDEHSKKSKASRFWSCKQKGWIKYGIRNRWKSRFDWYFLIVGIVDIGLIKEKKTYGDSHWETDKIENIAQA